MHDAIGGDEGRADLGAAEVDRQDRALDQSVHAVDSTQPAEREAPDSTKRAGDRRASVA